MNNHRHFGNASDLIPLVPSQDRVVSSYGYTQEYVDDNSCVAATPRQPAVTAPFPPPGTYLGARNFYVSEQVPLNRRGSGVVPPPTDEQDYYGAIGACLLYTSDAADE